MILTTILMGAVIGAAVIGVVAVFWNSILDWIKRAIPKVKAVVEGILYGTSVFISKIKEAAKQIQKHYSKVGTKWQETIVEKNVSYRELPEEIQQKVRTDNVEVDFTRELELSLETR